MNTKGKLIDKSTLQFERLFPGPIERIWEYITDQEKRSLWFAGGSSNVKVGGEMSFVFHNAQLCKNHEPIPDKYKEYGDGYTSHAKVIKCDPPRLFCIEWEGLVTFELEQLGDQVKLTLIHEKLSDSKEAKVGTLAGWHTHLDILDAVLSDKTLAGFWSMHTALEDVYEKLVN